MRRRNQNLLKLAPTPTSQAPAEDPNPEAAEPEVVQAVSDYLKSIHIGGVRTGAKGRS